MLEPIVDTTSLRIALIFALTCAAVLLLRKQDTHHAGFRVRSGTAVVLPAIAAALGRRGSPCFSQRSRTRPTYSNGRCCNNGRCLACVFTTLRNRGALTSP
jgi:hypothetical protein